VSGAKAGATAALAPLGFPVAAAVNLARPLAESVLSAGREVVGMSPEEREQAGILGTGVRAGQAGMETLKEKAIDPAIEKVMGGAESVEEAAFGKRQEVPDRAPAPAEDVRAAEPAGTSDQTLEPSSRIGAKIVDGKVIFTNVGVGGDTTSKTGPGYREGVSAFREKMRAHQAGLGPPPPGKITAAGHVVPGGHMLGDPDAPLPGDEDYPTGGFVSKPGGEIEDPTKALTAEGWARMTPAGKRAYLGEVMNVGAAKRAQAEGTLAEHEARMATDPDYAAENRLVLWQYFVDKAAESNEVATAVAATMAEFAKLTGKADGDPAYEAAEEQAKRAAVGNYLNEKHAEVAKWDDVLSRNLGLTFS
jgi:hypothetical protein